MFQSLVAGLVSLMIPLTYLTRKDTTPPWTTIYQSTKTAEMLTSATTMYKICFDLQSLMKQQKATVFSISSCSRPLPHEWMQATVLIIMPVWLLYKHSRRFTFQSALLLVLLPRTFEWTHERVFRARCSSLSLRGIYFPGAYTSKEYARTKEYNVCLLLCDIITVHNIDILIVFAEKFRYCYHFFVNNKSFPNQ